MLKASTLLAQDLHADVEAGASRRLRAHRGTANDGADAGGGGVGSGIETRGYDSQAAGVVSAGGLADASRYKSVALYAEVKLAQALDASSQACPDARQEDGGLAPNKLRTAVCCQLLGEFAALCGPFSKVLVTLRDELLAAVYSDSYSPESGVDRPLAFDQLPWFTVAARLREEKGALAAEREAIQARLQDQAQQVTAVEGALLALQAGLDQGEAVAGALRAALAASQAAEAKARAEAVAQRHEASRLGLEVERAREEAAEARRAAAAAQAAEAAAGQQAARWQRQAQAATLEAQAAVGIAAERVAPGEAAATGAALAEAEEQLRDAREQAAALQAQAAALQGQDLTPRPAWPGSDGSGGRPAAGSTRVRLAALLEQQEAERGQAAAALALARALAAPDAPAGPWRLSVAVPSSQYFLTELPESAASGGAAGPAGQLAEAPGAAGPQGGAAAAPLQQLPASSSQPQAHGPCATALGLGAHVPRLLRWAGPPLPLATWQLPALEAELRAIWRAKAASDAVLGPLPLHTFLQQHLQQRGGPAAAGPAPLAADEQLGAAAAAYSLFHAVCEQRHASPWVRLFWSVLTGQLAEGVQAGQQGMLLGVRRVVAALGAAGGADGGALLEDAGTALRLLFPRRQRRRLAELREALQGCCSSGRGGGGDGGSAPAAGGQLLASGPLLAALDAALVAPPMVQACADAGAAGVQAGTRESGAAGGAGEAAGWVALLAEQHLQEAEEGADAALHAARLVLQAAAERQEPGPGAPAACGDGAAPGVAGGVGVQRLAADRVPWQEVAAAVGTAAVGPGPLAPGAGDAAVSATSKGSDAAPGDRSLAAAALVARRASGGGGRGVSGPAPGSAGAAAAVLVRGLAVGQPAGAQVTVDEVLAALQRGCVLGGCEGGGANDWAAALRWATAARRQA